MANYGWNIVPGRVLMPKAGQTTNGVPFSVPGSALVLQLQIPALTGSATCKLQSLVVPRLAHVLLARAGREDH